MSLYDSSEGTTDLKHLPRLPNLLFRARGRSRRSCDTLSAKVLSPFFQAHIASDRSLRYGEFVLCPTATGSPYRQRYVLAQSICSSD